MSEDLLHHMTEVACVRSWDDEGWGPYHKRLLTMCVKIENNGWKKRNGMTQHQKILNHFKKVGSITCREGMIEYSIQALPKRISELRQAGYDIKSVTKYHPVTQQKYVRYYYQSKAA